MIMDPENDLEEISTAEAAMRLDCSQHHVARLIRQGKLKGRRNGPRHYRVTVRSVDHYRDSAGEPTC